MTALHLAGPDDLDRLATLGAAFHAEMGLDRPDDTRRAALLPLLTGSPHGCAYLIGPTRAPIGYAVITFGWSVEYGGLDGFIDEIYIRPAVRGRGIATEVLTDLPRALAAAGLRALHLEVDKGDDHARRLHERAGFVARDRTLLMTRRL